MTPEELRKVEQIVNRRIREDIPLQDHRNVPMEEAKRMGAIALFGEKYGDEVRVVQFGNSVEFCGGCHAKSTGRLGLFRIVSESSVAAGVRRIEALTGKAAEESVYMQQDLLTSLKELFNNAKDLTAAIQKTIEENSGLKAQVEDFVKQKVQQIKASLLERAEDINGVKVLKSVLPMSISPDAVKDLAFQVSGQLPEKMLCVLGSSYEGKPLLTVMISKDLVKVNALNAGQMVREAAKLIQGGGGGAPHFATAGGKNVNGLEAAVEKVLELANL